MYGKKEVVSDLNLDLLEGEITVLLGHNGAGKTTTINIATGFLAPTQGSVLIGDLNVIKNTADARKCIGLCTERLNLFQKLTCKEHLIFFLKLKGIYSANHLNSVKDYLEYLGLKDKQNTRSGALSNGQQRKLSLACAFIGDTKVVFLDEPSTGLDPTSRQEMWSFLKRMRTNRTILLTTHDMNEAELLGDRIAIMVEGRVKCCGTPMFLKEAYGIGYEMTFIKSHDCVTAEITKIVTKAMPEAIYTGETNSEIFYLLPEDLTHKFPEFLMTLEHRQAPLKYASYTLSATSIEDVFLRAGANARRVSEDENSLADEEEQAPNTRLPASKMSRVNRATANMRVSRPTADRRVSSAPFNRRFSMRGEKIMGAGMDMLFKNDDLITARILRNSQTVHTGAVKLFLQQTKATFIKQYILFRRHPVSSSLALILPPILMLLSVATDEQSTNQQTNAVNFSLQSLHDLVTPFWTNNHSDPGLVQFYKGQFESSEFIQAQETNPNDFFLDWISNHGVDRFETKMVVGAKLSTPNVITAFYQPKVIHSQGIAVQLILDARVKAELGGEYSVRSGIQDDTSQLSEELHTFEFINLIFALVPILLASRIISERSEGSKHLQELCGTYPGAYWLGTFLFDYIIFTVVVLTIMMVLTIKPQKLIIHSRYVATFTFFMVYGLSSFPNIYFIEHFFNRTAIGIVFLIVIKVSGITFVRMIALNNWFKSEDSAFIGTVSSLISPDYLFAYILLGLMNYDCTDDDDQTVSAVSPFLEKDFGLLYSIFIFLITACFSWLAVFCIEFKLHIFLWRSCFYYKIIMRKASYPRPIHEDVDVKAEREKIKTTDIATLKKKNAILLVDAQKNYARQCSSRCAVHSLSLSIGHNECFGILGQTGSGKTTIFKMLTGEVSITHGDIFVHGDSVKTTRTQKTIGYCPQLPALQHRLTGREVLLLYARLKGVVGDSVSQLVEDIIDFIKLRPHEDKQTKNYSNGTKRKLSVGIAIVCNPNLLVLDDPTAGMDPVSRRNMWDIMLSIKAHKRTILMTSHSIEECQALCGKFAIIKKGQLLCLGSRESLENKFKTVYSVFLYANQLENGLLIPIEPAVDFVHGSFINVVLFSKQKALCQLQIPQHVRLSALFTILEKAKESYNLKHYTVQKTSLEQIFFKMIKEEHY